MNGKKHDELVSGDVIIIPSSFEGGASIRALVMGPSRPSREPGLLIVPITFPDDPDEADDGPWEFMHFMTEADEVEVELA